MNIPTMHIMIMHIRGRQFPAPATTMPTGMRHWSMRTVTSLTCTTAINIDVRVIQAGSPLLPA